MELLPPNSKGPLFYNVCALLPTLGSPESGVGHSCLNFATLYFSLAVDSCHMKAVVEIVTAVLTQRSAMLHDNAGVEWGWKGVCGRGKRPLIVTHWTHSATRVAIDGYLALRKAHGPCYSTWFPANVTPLNDSRRFQRQVSNQRQGFYLSWKLLSEGQSTFLFSVFSILSFICYSFILSEGMGNG